MGKSRSKKRKPSLQSLTQAGQNFLDKGQYADALSHFRKLWLNHGTQYKVSLIESYVGRIKQLANKSLFDEAALIWEGMYNLIKEILYIDLYLSCLLAAEKYDKIAALLAKHPECLVDNDLKKCIATVIAPYFLTDAVPIVKLFTPLKELSKQKKFILSGIEAYSLGENEKLASLLRDISFRSPYKTIALTLKQAVKLEQEPNSAVIQWFENFTDIVYEPLIRCLQFIFNFDLSLLQQSKSLDKTVLEIGHVCRNWSPEKVKVIRQLAQVGEDPEILLDFILAYHDQLNKKEIAQKLAFKLLVQQPKKIAAYERVFGKISRFDASRIQALYCEASNNVERALNYWTRCTQELKKGKAVEQPLQLAILLRHIAYLEQRYHGAEYDDEYESMMIKRIDESLLYDLYHKESHHHLIHYYKNKDKKKLKHVIDRALDIYPQDFLINIEAANLAYHQKKFKKAVTFSQKALQTDPLSQSASELLVEITLSDTRAQLRKGKAQISHKILENLPGHVIQKAHHRILVRVISTLIQMKLHDKTSHQSWFEREGTQEIPLSNCLAALTESQYIQEPIKLDIKGLRKITHFKKEDILCMTEIFSYYDRMNIPPAYQTIKTIINKAAKISLPLEDANRICDCFKQIKLFELLKQFSLAYLKRYPDDPFLVFCNVFAKLGGNPRKSSKGDSEVLANALKQSVGQKNHKVADEIDDFLSQTRFGADLFQAFNMFNHMPEEMKSMLMEMAGD